MDKINLRYQTVLKPDGTLVVHETLVTDQDTIQACSHEPVIIQGESLGELQALMRQVYNDIRKYPPISEEDIEAELYGKDIVIDGFTNDEDNVINLSEYFA